MTTGHIDLSLMPRGANPLIPIRSALATSSCPIWVRTSGAKADAELRTEMEALPPADRARVTPYYVDFHEEE